MRQLSPVKKVIALLPSVTGDRFLTPTVVPALMGLLHDISGRKSKRSPAPTNSDKVFTS